MRFSRTILLLWSLVLATIVGLGVGCSPKGPSAINVREAIIGEWERYDPKYKGKETLEFFKDGTVSLFHEAFGFPWTGDYKFIDNNRIKVNLGGPWALVGPIVCKVSISGDKLTLSPPDGDVAEYKRVSSNDPYEAAKEARQAGIFGTYMLQDPNAPPTFLELRRNGTIYLSASGKWEIEGTRVELRGMEREQASQGARINGDTILKSDDTLVKQGGSALIKTEEFRLWTRYTGFHRPAPRPLQYGETAEMVEEEWRKHRIAACILELNPDGTYSFHNLSAKQRKTGTGKWETETDRIRLYIEGDTRFLEGLDVGVATEGGRRFLEGVITRNTRNEDIIIREDLEWEKEEGAKLIKTAQVRVWSMYMGQGGSHILELKRDGTWVERFVAKWERKDNVIWVYLKGQEPLELKIRGDTLITGGGEIFVKEAVKGHRSQ